MNGSLNDEGDQRSLSEDEGRNSDNENEPLNNDQPDDNENNDETGRRIDPKTSKKRIVRNPIPKLNPERLKGPKGVHTIEEYFKGFKFHGKGHEKHDLDRVMKRLEHWGHRLFPKYQFDDFIEKLEALGTKKELQTFLTRYRKDMILDEVIIRDEDDAVDEREKSPEPIDEFDLLIAEQIEKSKQAATTAEKTQRNNDVFDSLLNSQSQKTVNNSQQVNNSESNVPTESEEEIKERIERNRRLAIERRQAKLRRDEELKRAKVSAPETEVAEETPKSSNDLPLTDENTSNEFSSAANDKEQTPTLTDEEINSIFNSDTQPGNSTDTQDPGASDESQQLSKTGENNSNSTNVPKSLLTNEELEEEINNAVNQFAQQKKQFNST